MKTPIIPLVFWLSAFPSQIALCQTSTAPSYVVTETGPHHRVWSTVTWQTNETGVVEASTNAAYTEVATGLNYQNTNNQWTPAQEQIDLLDSGGASATHGQHQAFFPPDLSQGKIVLTMPDGRQLQSRPAGLAYFDGTNSVLIAQLTNTTGFLFGNQVIYSNCLVGGVNASVRYTYTKCGFEQDVILQDRPLPPEQYGLASANCRLLVLTEFFSPPQPSVTTNTTTLAGLACDNDEVDWGSMRLAQGKAFAMQSAADAALTTHTWELLDGRQILVEEVPLKVLALGLENLQQHQASLTTRKYSHMALNDLKLPPSRPAPKGQHKLVRLASNPIQKGYVIDYVTVNGTMGPYTFTGDNTYYVSANVILSGAVTFEGGAVLKYATNTSVSIGSGVTVNWLGTPFRPVVLTSKDDKSVGATITGASGTVANLYANPALSIVGQSGLTITNFRICGAQQAISITGGGVAFYNGQIVTCGNGINITGSGVQLRNMLFAKVGTSLNSIQFAGISAENVTFAGTNTMAPNYFTSDDPSHDTFTVSCTNCIIADMTQFTTGSGAVLSGAYNGFYNIGSLTPFGANSHSTIIPPFQQAGAGYYYLTNGCAFKGSGSTAIDSTLLAGLPQRTTTAPTIYTNTTIRSTTRWSPVSRGNTSAPDLGYYYDAMDFLISGLTLDSTVTLTNGVAIGCFGNSDAIKPSPGAFVSQGSPTAMNELFWYPAVQEQPILFNNGATPSATLLGSTGAGAVDNVTLRFTDIPMQGSRQYFYPVNSSYDALVWTITNCRFRGVDCEAIPLLANAYYQGSQISLQNSDLERCTISFTAGDVTGTQAPLSLYLYNNLYWSNKVTFTYDASGASDSCIWIVNDSLFDGTSLTFTGNGSYAGQMSAASDAFNNTSNPLGGSGHVTLTSLSYAPGPYGNRYINASTPTLVDKGSRIAPFAGLYHYTMYTNLLDGFELPETNTEVDIGFHYVATDAYGNPLDTGGSGIPDYLADSNGNGIYDAGDFSNWTIFSTDGSGLSDSWKLQYGLSPDSVTSGKNVVSDAYANPAGDGWSNLQKFQKGWNPNTFYTPPPPQATVTTTTGGDVLISWEPSQGNVTGYLVYRSGVLIATLVSTATSWTDTAYIPNSNDEFNGDIPSYYVIAVYKNAGVSTDSLPSIAQTPVNPEMAVSVAIARGPDGQYYLLAPNIPSAVTTLRFYLYSSDDGVYYPNDLFDIYNQPLQTFAPNVPASFDVAAGSFVNGIYPIPSSVIPSLYPYYASYIFEVVPMGADSSLGPINYVQPNFYTIQTDFANLDSSFPSWDTPLPFLDGSSQLLQNLVFQLEAADGSSQYGFLVNEVVSGLGSQTAFTLPASAYAYAGFHTRYSDLPSWTYEFKPFEDNYFFRNFVVAASSDLNTDGSLASGASGYSSSYPYITVGNDPPSIFPDYTKAAADFTGSITPLLSATAPQYIFPSSGNIGMNNNNGNLNLVATENVFGLPIQSVLEAYYPSGEQYYSPGGTPIADPAMSSESFYAAFAAPQLANSSYIFLADNFDFFPGDSGFNPVNASTGPLIASVGSPLLVSAWAKMALANGLPNVSAWLEQYFDKAYVVDSSGNITANQTGILSEYGEFFPTVPGTVALTSKNNAIDGSHGTLKIPVIGLYTDANHDGVIDTTFAGPDCCTPSHPFRFWINDDNDYGDTGGNDIPGFPALEAQKNQTPNGVSGFINGTRDLIDFFPVYIDIQSLVQDIQANPAYANLTFRLSQVDSALSCVETTLTPGNPQQYLTDYNLALFLAGSSTTPITSAGFTLSSSFLNTIAQGGGIILVEGSTNTSNPLVLDVLDGASVIAEAQLPLSITNVEQMFRHKNLTASVLGQLDGPGDRLTSTDVPNEPDCTANNFIFVHGYNVNPQQARGWESEMYKRMYWSGNHAKFYGITWHGNETQQSLLGLVQYTPNFQTNVANAFLTARDLATFINSLSGPNTVAAHSLGNMLALSALSDYGAKIQNYFMIDAAVPIEAIDPAAPYSASMVPAAWSPYNQTLWASDWYNLNWPSGDKRATLNWNGRFANLNHAQVYNFYSSGEEVLRQWTGGSPPSTFFGIALSQIVAYLQGRPGYNIWTWQELMKGQMSSTLNNTILSSDHGGWSFNSAYNLTVSQANALQPSQLQAQPFFNFSAGSGFTADLALLGSGGSAYAQTYRNRILSDAIPAVTLPLGANLVTDGGIVAGNFDMQNLYENGWPIPGVRQGAPAVGEWHHSDIRQVAFTYTYPLLNKLVILGSLK